jgi:GH24 family phage-related lysozyme (muramidase)
MSSCRIPGSVCGSTAPPLDADTLVRWWSPVPGPLCAPPPERQWHNYSRPGGFAASTLTLSPDAVALLQAIEQLRLAPYDDQTGKATKAWLKGATIGYGHLIAKDEWPTYKDGISKEQADALFRADAKPFEIAVGEAIKVGVQQYEFDAMVILAFNIGKVGFRNSTVAKLINDPELATSTSSLENAWKSWNKSQGKVNQGLNNRRTAEWRIYTSGIYAGW